MNPEAKKRLLRYIPSGLYVVGVKSGAEKHAFTGSWLSQVSMKPPCVMLGVRKDSKSLQMMKDDKVFVINYISKENQKTLEHFFKPTKADGDRLGDFPYATGKTGAPILNEAIGFLECEVKNVVDDFGDHAIVVGEVIDADVKSEGPPLLMSDTPWHYGG